MRMVAEGHEMKGPLKKGVLSGLPTTALFDSILSDIELNIMCSQAGLKALYTQAHGDDTGMRSSSNVERETAGLIAGYSEANFVLHPDKNFVCDTRMKNVAMPCFEWLRLVAQKRDYGIQATGYVCRPAISVVMRDPLGRPDRPRIDIFKDEAITIHLMCARAISANKDITSVEFEWEVAKKENWPLRDLWRRMFGREEKVWDWLHTPVAYGGAGFLPYGEKWYTVKSNFASRRREEITLVEKPCFWEQVVDTWGGRISEEIINNFVKDTLTVKNPSLVEEGLEFKEVQVVQSRLDYAPEQYKTIAYEVLANRVSVIARAKDGWNGIYAEMVRKQIRSECGRDNKLFVKRISEEWANGDTEEMIKYMLQKGARMSLILAYIDGELESGTPTRCVYNPELAGNVWKRYLGVQFQKFMGKLKYNGSLQHWKNALFVAEVNFNNVCRYILPKVGV